MEVWAFDGHRAGLKPVLRRVWAKRGRRPVAVAEPRYAWLDLDGFVRPTTGAVEWFPCDAVNTALFAAVLARFAAAVGCTAETLRGRARQSERDRGLRAGPTADERERIGSLEREAREPRRANEILRKASAYSAMAELDRRSKP